MCWYTGRCGIQPFMAFLGPSPTPITEYLARHPEASMMSLAMSCGLCYDTVYRAEQGFFPPSFVTMLKLQQHAGIPVMAWAGTAAVRRRLERNADPDAHRRKVERWRKKRREMDPEFRRKEDEKFKRKDARRALKKQGIPVPPLPMSPLKAALKGLPPGAPEGSG